MIDKLRIERDLQGRKVNKLRGKVEKMHTRNGNKTSHKLEKIIKKLQNHEGQLMGEFWWTKKLDQVLVGSRW